jgi:hypothetical protein
LESSGNLISVFLSALNFTPSIKIVSSATVFLLLFCITIIYLHRRQNANSSTSQRLFSAHFSKPAKIISSYNPVLSSQKDTGRAIYNTDCKIYQFKLAIMIVMCYIIYENVIYTRRGETFMQNDLAAVTFEQFKSVYDQCCSMIPLQKNQSMFSTQPSNIKQARLKKSVCMSLRQNCIFVFFA